LTFGIPILIAAVIATLLIVNRRLVVEVELRRRAVAELHQHREHLEEFVAARTRELGDKQQTDAEIRSRSAS